MRRKFLLGSALTAARDVHTVVTNGQAFTFEELTAAPPQTLQEEN